jgi:uncharacterized protein (DUF58 family)
MLYARLNRLSLLGVRRTRTIGRDEEFERLRDYAPGDEFRNIEWRATARRRKLTVKDFQTSHSQRLVFMIDCGRMMVNESAGLSLLDRAFDAALTLAHVALSRGDQVGILCFADRILRWVDPKGGAHQTGKLVHAAHDVHADLVESRYDLAFLHLAKRCRKRTMTVLMTNLIDEVNARQVHGHLTNLVGRHLPLAVFLRDHEIYDRVQALPGAAELRAGAVPPRELFRAAAAADILEWRRQAIASLRREGVLGIDAFAEDATAPLVNEYLRAKAMHLL